MDMSWFEQFWHQFHFMRPWWLLALLPLAGLWWLRWKSESTPVWQDGLPEHLRKALTIAQQGWAKLLPLKLLSVLIVVGVVVCAGPTWQRQASPFGEDKAQLVVVLDAGESMLETDVAPSRLIRAKQKISDLIAHRAGGETALVVYAGSAHLAMPLTQDVQVFEPFLYAIEPSIMPVEGKNAAKALDLIEMQLAESLGATVLLVSDGVSAAASQAYQQYFDQHPHQLLVLGVGDTTRSAALPMDRNSLTDLARSAGGHYIDISVDDSDIEKLDTWIERNMQLNGDSAMPWQDMGYYLLFPLTLLFLLWFRRGWLVQWAIAAMMISGALTPSMSYAAVESTAATSQQSEALSFEQRAAQAWWDLWLTPDQQGQRWFNKGRYLEAAKHFSLPLQKGVAYYYGSDFKRAHSQFMQMETDLGYYYAASALARQREYLAARNLLQALVDDENLDQQLRPNVEHNLMVIGDIVDEINRFSESQANTTEGLEESTELGDNPQTAEGADETTVAEALVRETLNAEEILGSQELADKWLSRVQADPKRFLRTKFQLQQLNGSNQLAAPSAEVSNE